MTTDAVGARLTAWFARKLPGASQLRVESIDRVDFGHSAEMMLLTLAWREDGADRRRDVVLRARPPQPWLLEPYDLRRQFDILRALEATPVLAPRALWIEETGEVLGRPFYVMECLPGTVYEQNIPPELKDSPGRLRCMAERVMEQIAAIHLIDLHATGLDALGDGRDYLDRELDRWSGQVARWQHGPMPALERLSAELRARHPEPTPQVTLVHGDPKAGNFAFIADKVTGVFDWELASVGDPMADIGWAEVTWRTTLPFSMLSRSLIDELLPRYEKLTGIAVHHRPWYRSMQAFKMAVIMLVGSMLFQDGFTDDRRFAAMASFGPSLTKLALRELDEDLARDDAEAGWPGADRRPQ